MASADAVYGVIAGFGPTAVSSVLVAERTPIRLLGGAFVLYLGIRTFRSEPAERTTDPVNTPGVGKAR